MNHKTLKTVALASAALFALHFAPVAQAQEAEKLNRDERAALSLVIDGLAIQTGRIWVGVYDSADAWDAQTEVRTQWVDIVDARATLLLEGVPTGEIGVQVFHDANGNNDFDTNVVGIPRERYGFSNNPRPRFRGANWEEAVLVLEPGETRELTITLHGVRG